VYGYPPERAAEIEITVLADHHGPLEVVLLVAFDEAAAAPLRAALDGRSGPGGSEHTP
jgi:O-acetyl-ADP-ribose deacetylase (regulator of RNase III)